MKRLKRGRPLRTITPEEAIALQVLEEISYGAKFQFKSPSIKPNKVFHESTGYSRVRKIGSFSLFKDRDRDTLRQNEELLEYLHPDLSNEINAFKETAANALSALMDFDLAKDRLIDALKARVDVDRAERRYNLTPPERK